MDKLDFYNVELEKAKTILWKTTYSSDLKRAKAARKVLKNKKLLNEYVRLRIEKQRNAERKKKFVAFWKKLWRLITFRN